MRDVQIKNSQCNGCWYSVMMKTSLTPDPTQVACSFSPTARIYGLVIDNVTESKR
jgi:hypothetical protein